MKSLSIAAFVAAILVAAMPAEVAAQTGSIGGTITDAATTNPISGVNVQIYNATGGFVTSAVTNASGVYTTTSTLAAGTYYARTVVTTTQNYIDELYNNIPALGCAVTAGTPIVVTTVAVTGIDFALTPGGTISGTVTDAATMVGLVGVTIQINSASGAFAKSVVTIAGGSYSAVGLPTGNYFARTIVTSAQNYVDELWDNIPCVGCSITTGTPIAVTAGAVHGAIDFALSAGASISGTVSDAVTLAGLSSVNVQVYTSTGAFAKSGVTAVGGTYTIRGLPAGNYFARTFVPPPQNYVDELWDDIQCLNCSVTTGTVIPVAPGAAVAGISFALSPGGTIAGTVTDAVTTSGVIGINVQILTSTGAVAKGGLTDGMGNYSVIGLPAGTFYARTTTAYLSNYIDQLFNHVPCPFGINCTVTSGTAINVTMGTTQTASFALDRAGSISGTVTDAGTSAGLAGVNIFVYNSTGVFVNSTTTGPGGTYTVSGLSANGNYFARTAVTGTLTYIDKLWDNIQCFNCVVTTGTAISVTVGMTHAGINFALSPGGAISGTVSDAGTSVGLSSITVQVYTSTGAFFKSTTTSTCNGGPYTVGGLPTGTYFARTAVPSNQNYIDEAYDNIPCLNCSPTSVGTPIAVTVGSTHGGIDFALSPGGIITGVVTDAGTSAGLGSVSVQVFTSTGSFAKSAFTPVSGIYSVSGLPSGTYFARTFVQITMNYVDKLFDNIPCVPCTVTTGTPIAVTAGATHGGVSFALSPGGTITGSVTDAGTLAALASVTVQVYSSTGLSVKVTSTNASGAYSVAGLPTGNYFARTFVPNTLNYVDELWDNIPCLGCTVTIGTAISVTVGATHSGVNFGLAGGGSISGMITDAVTTNGLGGVNVTVYTSTGVGIKSAVTSGTGSYSVVGLANGSYFARTFVPNTLNYIDELFNDIPCAPSCTITSGTAFSVTVGVTTGGVNFALAPGGSITGTVTDVATTAVLGNVTVQVYNSTGTFVRGAVTTGTGSYSVGGLLTGTYYARTFVPSTLNYIDELWDNIPCLNCVVTTGTAIAVMMGSAHASVDFALSVGGIISGTVTDQNTTAPLSGINVQVSTSTGAFAKSTTTSPSGTFAVMGLPTGSYFARTAVSATQYYVDEVYNNITCVTCNVTSGTPIAVTAGATHGGIDFALVPGGSIAGLVTDAVTSAGIPFATVQVYSSTGNFLKGVTSNSVGSYAVASLLPGSYFVRTSNFAGLNYIDELYDNIPCIGCNVTTGTPVVVAGGATTSGINFGLAPGGGLAGTVTDEGTNGPLASITVQVFTSSGAFAKNISTASNGTYTILGLPTGTYYVRTAVPSTLNYVDEVFNNIPCVGCNPTSGTAISVTVGATTGGVNFALAPGGSITGTVTDAATSAGLVSLQVTVFTSSGQGIKSVLTAAGGGYTLTGLAAGTYFVRTFVSATQFYVDKVYNNISCIDGPSCAATNGTPISVAAPATTGGINFALQAAGTITGTVTDAVTGAPVPTSVQVFSSTGAAGKSAGINLNTGVYTLTGLPPGTYYVRTFASAPYVDELWDNIPCLGCTVTTGTAIVVTAGAAHGGINFALSVGGGISGTVTDASTSLGLSGVVVRVYTSTGVAAKQATTSGTGSFSISGFPTGSYFARTFVPSTLNYVDELYDNIACGTCVVTTGTAISVTAGATHSGVNFGLAGSTHATPPSLVWGGGLRLNLANPTEQWASAQAVAGRSYCAVVVPDRTAVSSAGYGMGTPVQFAAFRNDLSTVLGSASGAGPVGSCFVAPATESVFFKVKPTDTVTRPYRLQTVETTLWANWWFVGTSYSSYTLLRNTAAFGGDVNATITWRDETGAVVSTETVLIPQGGIVFRDARGRVGSAITGSVEVAFDSGPEGLVGSQTTLSGVTGLSFDTLLMTRKLR